MERSWAPLEPLFLPLGLKASKCHPEDTTGHHLLTCSTDDDNRDNGALTEMDISNNNLTHGELKSDHNSYVEGHKHETDMTGVIALSETLKL